MKNRCKIFVSTACVCNGVKGVAKAKCPGTSIEGLEIAYLIKTDGNSRFRRYIQRFSRSRKGLGYRELQIFERRHFEISI